MGIELDVLVGHPEHDLLFVATQVARAAGLQRPSQSIAQNGHLRGSGARIQVSEVESLYKLCRDGHMIKSNSWLFDEARCYDLLMRGNAPQSEPFRRWVTEEVLPTIRKTGSYNAAESSNPIAQGVMDELKAARGELAELKALIQGMNLTAPVVAVESPYVGLH